MRDVKPDDRIFEIIKFSSFSLYLMNQFLYPKLFPLHLLHNSIEDVRNFKKQYFFIVKFR